METTQTKILPLSRKPRRSFVIETTLYELVEAVIDIAGPDEKKLIKEVTLNLLTKVKPSIRVTGH
jgi:hypothetical protein